MRRNAALAVIWCAILLVGLVAGAVPVSGASQQATSTAAQTDECTVPYDRMNERHQDRTGSPVSVSATAPAPGVVSLEYTVPNEYDSFTVSVPDHQDIRHVEGFEELHPGYFEYTASGTAQIEYAVNRSFQIPDANGSNDLVETYTSHNDKVATSVIPYHEDGYFQLEFPDGGYAGTSVMYVGEIAHVETITNGPNRHAVVIPSAVDSSAGNASLEGLQLGTETINPRHYYCESTLFFHPGNVRGYASGADTVSGDEWKENNFASHTPLHEYVHLNQRYTVSDEMQWFTEGSATYLTARILYDNGLLTSSEYDAQLTYWDHHSSGSNLTNPSSYSPKSGATQVRDDYTAGSLILARLDADLRANGDATIYDLFTAVGSGDPAGQYDVSAFHDDYEQLGGDRSEAELRFLIEQPDTAVEPAYVTSSARVLPDSFTRHPSHTDTTPREIEAYSLVFFLGVSIIIIWSVWKPKRTTSDQDE